MQLSGLIIDSLEFARTGRSLSGVVAVAALRRLVDLLADDTGELVWSVRGELAVDNTGERRSWLTIAIEGGLRLQCQRCLASMPWHLKVESRLLLMPPGRDWPDESLIGFEEGGDADPVEALAEQVLLDLVEDEVLLALPIAPRHESCVVPVHDDGRLAASPFARLAVLKKAH
ncbi:MAG: hypothetical protein RL695_1197 [Pseudomonadota bacterium]